MSCCEPGAGRDGIRLWRDEYLIWASGSVVQGRGSVDISSCIGNAIRSSGERRQHAAPSVKLSPRLAAWRGNKKRRLYSRFGVRFSLHGKPRCKTSDRIRTASPALSLPSVILLSSLPVSSMFFDAEREKPQT